MSSFKEVRELLLVAYDSEIINDEEFLVLFEIIAQEIRSFLTIPTQDLNLKTCKTTSAWLSFALKKRMSQDWQTYYRYLKL